MKQQGPRSTGRLRTVGVLWAGLLLAGGATAALPPSAGRGTALQAPSMLTGHARMGAIQLSWTPPQGVQVPEGYHLYRSLTAGGPYSLLGTVTCATACVYVDKQVANGIRYVYVVRAFDSDGHEGPSSVEASAVGDTVAPSASIKSLSAGQHFSGHGPLMVTGVAIDAASGVAGVGIAIRRNDTREWWSGSQWARARRVVIPVDVTGPGPAVKWSVGIQDVMWSQATSYTVQVDVRDVAGYALTPAASATIFVDTPAILTVSVAAAPSAVTAGQPFNVSVLVANTGGGEARDVQAGRPIERGTAGLAASQPSQESRIPSLAPGEFATFSWSYSTTSPGTLTFTASATGVDAGSGDPAQVLVGTSNDVLVRLPARLDVVVTPAPANVRQGTSMTVRMLVTNSGQSDAQVTQVTLHPAQPGLVTHLHGPVPVPPFRLVGGESREILWTASAAGSGAVAFTGAAAGFDETSGAVTNAAPTTSAPVGVAAAPSGIQLASSVDSAAISARVTVTASVRDAGGIPVPGVPVQFAVLAGKGKLDQQTTVSDERGLAATTLTLAKEVGITTVEGRAGALLASISVEGVLPGEGGQILSRNFFDPARGEVVDVSVHLPRSSRVKVRVFSLSGELIVTLADTNAPAGPAKYAWDGRNTAGAVVQNGVYFFSVQAGAILTSRRVIVLKERP